MKFLKYLDIRKFPRTDRYYFLFNIVLGLWTLFFFVLTRDTPMQQSLINMLFDQAIEMRTSIFELGRECDAKISSKNIILLSFDDIAMKDLDRPHMTPRNKIADLIKFAYEGGASVIMIDIDLSEADYTPARKLLGDFKPMTGQERDSELINLLKKIKNDADSNTKIVIGSNIYSDKTIKDNEFAALADNKKIYLATPTVSGSRRNDRTIRFWQPYVEITNNDGEIQEREILWSFQTLALVLTEGGAEDLEKIKQKILYEDENEFTINFKNGKNFVLYREISLNNDMILRNTQSLQYNRIQYIFNHNKFGDRAINKDNIGRWRDNSLDNPNIDFKDKIVIIGREDKECGDFLNTLIGRMPGLYVHGNATATILGKTQPHISPIWKYIFIEIFLIFVTAYVFIYFKYSGAKRFVFLLTILCGICSYAYFWLTNEFVYLTCSFASIGVYNFISRMEDFFKKGNLIKSFIKKIFRRKSDKKCVNLEKND